MKYIQASTKKYREAGCAVASRPGGGLRKEKNNGF
nr:MAG TPA: hypothetical protein [Caudoviricetes sp.]